MKYNIRISVDIDLETESTPVADHILSRLKAIVRDALIAHGLPQNELDEHGDATLTDEEILKLLKV